MNEFSRHANLLLIYILLGVLTGALIVEIYFNQPPCPLCQIQRLGMLGLISAELLNIRFGVRMPHYGLSYLSALVGITASIYQIMLHLCPGNIPYGSLIFGLRPYVWSFIVFACAIVGMSLLLFFYKPVERVEDPRKMSGLVGISFFLALLITVLNLIMSISHCQGFPFSC